MQRTEQQTEAIEDLAPRLCVDAGAGSGKTRVLVERMVHLLDQRSTGLDEIVAITFTEKAAAEMKERLRKAFRARAPQEDAVEMSRWRDLERRVDSARISTIHSFCAGLLRENALRLGLDPDFAVLADADAVLMTHEVAIGALHQLLGIGDAAAMHLAGEVPLSQLTESIETMLRHRSLVERIAARWPIDSPDALQARWKQDVEQERQRWVRALQRSPRLRNFRAQLAAFDGTCLKEKDAREVLRRVMLDGLQAIEAAPDTPTAGQAIARIASQSARGTRACNWNSPETVRELKALQEALKRWLAQQFPALDLDPEAEAQSARLTCGLYAVYGKAADALDRAKRAANALDFDDLILGALHVLRAYPDLRERIARGMRFLLVDEFQDTDGVQLEIARLLSDHPAGPDLFIVGDAKQSIYLFRGAEVEVFHQERDRADKTIRMDRNFRSLPDVLGFVNEFFVASGLLEGVEPYRPLVPHRKAAKESRIAFLIPEMQPGAKTADYRRHEATLIAHHIAALCKGKPPLRLHLDGSATARTATFGDMAVLFRSLSDVFLYEEAFRRARIPYALVAGAGFYRRQEVLDILNLLRIIDDPWDEAALLGFLRGPIAGLSDESILRLAQAGGLAAVFNAAIVPERLEEPDSLAAARALVAALRAQVQQPLPAFLAHVLGVTGYEALLLSQYMGVQKTANVRKLVKLAKDFVQQRPRSLRAFIQYVDAIGSQEIREAEARLQPEGIGAVTLMTIHSAKGLEFPIVFVPDLSRGVKVAGGDHLVLHRDLGMALKVINRRGQVASSTIGQVMAKRHRDEAMAEHARLLYVALTRAQDYLVLSGAPSPDKASWLAALDEQYRLFEKTDGDTIAGDSWRAVVQRSGRVDQKISGGPVAHTVPPPEAFERRIRGIEAAAASRKTFPVSALLDHMAGGFDEHEERGLETDRPGASVHSVSALAWGSLVHRVFERWDFRNSVLPDLDQLVRDAGLGLQHHNKLVADLQRMVQQFLETPLAARLAQDNHLQREVPFYLNAGTAVISGTIDALLSDGTLIDYKTGVFDQQRHARYEWQLLLYAAAVRRLYRHQPRQGLLCYVEAGVVKAIDLDEEHTEYAFRHAREVIAHMR